VKKVKPEVETAEAFKVTFPFLDVEELSVQALIKMTSRAKINIFFITPSFINNIANEKFRLLVCNLSTSIK
jgi:hypothetical protein